MKDKLDNFYSQLLWLYFAMGILVGLFIAGLILAIHLGVTK